MKKLNARCSVIAMNISCALTVSIVVVLYLNIINPLTLYGKVLHITIVFGTFFSASLGMFAVYCAKEGPYRKLAALLAATGCILWIACCGEALFRLIPIYDSRGDNPGVKFFWADWVSYKPNRFGHRDREFTPDKPSGTYRILVAGDSFTEGAGVSRSETFSHVLETQLNAQSGGGGCTFEVYNLGHCGMTTREEVSMLLAQAHIFRPDMIILAYVPSNDPEINAMPAFIPPGADIVNYVEELKQAYAVQAAKLGAGDVPFGPTTAMSHPQDTAQRIYAFTINILHSYMAYFMYRYGQFSSTVDSYAENIVALHSDGNVGWLATKAAMHDLAQFASERGIPLVGMIFPIIIDMELPKAIDDVLTKVAAAMRESGFTQVVELAPVFKAQARGATLGEFMLSRFDGHPSREGHELVGRCLAAVLPQSMGDAACLNAAGKASRP
jgi:hypothetical protein